MAYKNKAIGRKINIGSMFNFSFLANSLETKFAKNYTPNESIGRGVSENLFISFAKPDLEARSKPLF